MSYLFQTRLEQMPFKRAPKINIQGLAIGVNTGGHRVCQTHQNSM